MKKIMTSFLAVAVLLGLYVYSPENVYGASQYEYEENDSYETANIVRLGDSVSGNLSKDSDVDYYMVSPNADGKIDIEFCHTFKNSDNSWRVSIYVNDNGQYSKLSEYDIKLNSKESVSLPSIGAVQGRAYYVRVARYSYYGVVGEDYTIKTTFTASNNYEKELNDDFSSATVVELNQNYSGTLGKADDTDYYKIVAPVDGRIDIEFCHTFKNSDNSWRVSIYVNDNGQYSKLSEYDIKLNSKESISLPSIGAVQGRTYYVRVARYSYYGVVGEDYTIKTVFTASNNYEKELNDDFSSATVVELNQNYSGTLGKSDDTDYYKIVAPADGRIDIEFCHTFKNSDNSWRVSIYVNDNGQYSKLSEYDIKLNSKESVSLPSIGAVQGRAYYVRVARYSYYEVVGEDYTLKTKFYINTPSYLNAKVSKRTAKLTWGKVSGADGYEIYYKVAGGSGKYKKLNTTKKNSYSYKNLAKGKTYYFKVRAYKTIEHTKYYSKFTFAKKVKR